MTSRSGRAGASAPAAYSDAEAAELYDRLNPWGASDDFYLRLVMASASVVDVGCGTGALLRRAREDGHPGPLAGVDPDEAALAIARRRRDIEWRSAVAADLPWAARFELATMTGHAFQCLVTDHDVAAALQGIRRALVPGGAFAFETRNPAVREWQVWAAMEPIRVVDAAGRELAVTYEILAVDGGVVTFTDTTRNAAGRPLRVDEAALRFLTMAELADALGDAGFTIATQYGDWSMTPLEPTSREIITVARASAAEVGGRR